MREGGIILMGRGIGRGFFGDFRLLLSRNRTVPFYTLSLFYTHISTRHYAGCSRRLLHGSFPCVLTRSAMYPSRLLLELL